MKTIGSILTWNFDSYILLHIFPYIKLKIWVIKVARNFVTSLLPKTISYNINVVATFSLWYWRLHEFLLQMTQFSDPYLEPCLILHFYTVSNCFCRTFSTMWVDGTAAIMLYGDLRSAFNHGRHSRFYYSGYGEISNRYK